ncbi:MAG: metallophosphoesterase [Bacillus sp. (in: firmicutes)]
MKILVVSDSHGDAEILERLKQRYEQETVAMIHCGDSELPYGHSALKNFIYVKGNCDIDSRFLNERVEDVAGYRFFITHGHLYNIKMTLQNISYKVEEVQANIALFGHSHQAGSTMGPDHVLYVNPGSILLPRGRKERTYVILEIEGSTINVDFYDREGNPLKNLSATYQMN